jgi:hypothetical protein
MLNMADKSSYESAENTGIYKSLSKTIKICYKVYNVICYIYDSNELSYATVSSWMHNMDTSKLKMVENVPYLRTTTFIKSLLSLTMVRDFNSPI